MIRFKPSSEIAIQMRVIFLMCTLINEQKIELVG